MSFAKLARMKNGFWKQLLGSVLLLVFVISGRLHAAEYFVDVLDDSYSPSFLQINVGDTVTWTNQDEDDDAHSATSDDGAWIGGLMVGFGDQFSFTFQEAGPYPYHDLFDQFSGTIQVIAGNSLPSVTITNPVTDATFAAPATFSISASASDSDGSILNVEFFVDGLSIGVDTTENPYSATASNLVAGTYIISAVATDNSGGTQTSSITVTVVDSNISLSEPRFFEWTISVHDLGFASGKNQFRSGVDESH